MITDLEYLKSMSANDEHFISEMISLFREQVGEYGRQMPQLVEGKSYEDLSKLAHKAKSSVAVMGMNSVAELLQELEILSNEAKEVDRYSGMIDEFLKQCKLALVELEQYKPGI